MKILILELLVFTFDSFGFDFEDQNGFKSCQMNPNRHFCTIELSDYINQVSKVGSDQRMVELLCFLPFE